jgi:hypothetical protein
MMVSMDLISLTMSGLLPFLLLLRPLQPWFPPIDTPVGACASPASGRAPSAAPESSRAATHGGKKQNILVKGLKTLISMCRSNDALIHESHQQMSQRLSHLEERQCEMCTSMDLETSKPTVYPPLPPPAMEDPWTWYHNTDDDGEDDDGADDEIQEESE